MNETLNKLRPIEKLYLISKEKEGIYKKDIATKCLVSSLVNNKNIKDGKIVQEGLAANRSYEYTFMDLYQTEQYIELDKFLEGLTVFNKTLVELGIIKNVITVKKLLWLKLAKEKLSNTTLYYELQGYLSKELDGGKSLTRVVGAHENTDATMKFYNAMVSKMKAAKQKETEKK